ncbi:hypothetical protein CVT25_012425 [Psilocybe cyanescens]|uniref:Uncharacterized protein n=1 Tax=Psilocybe cyanescens TaxID=93625 RepID=A0A409XK85_PSICY|nr:hypothetical protein CVT25_012425 [Psilocybe cyanescens]
MFGSSTRGLRPVQKHVLYCACVLSIVMYGFHLWYFAAAHCKGALHHLSTMQCSAALWITGAFCTSPTSGVEALAGLPPINLLLCCLSERADYWFATLTPTHPVRAFLSGFNCGTIVPHPSLSIQTMSEPEIFCTSGTLFESDTNVLALMETLLQMKPTLPTGCSIFFIFIFFFKSSICIPVRKNSPVAKYKSPTSTGTRKDDRVFDSWTAFRTKSILMTARFLVAMPTRN